jgi:hypothetical protein
VESAAEQARGRTDPPRDLREQMIAETSAYLSWALAEDRGLPRIPRWRVDGGGLAALLEHPGARVLVRGWWGRVLSSAWTK